MKACAQAAVSLKEIIDSFGEIKVDTAVQREAVVLFRLLYRLRLIRDTTTLVEKQELTESQNLDGDVRELAHDITEMTEAAIGQAQLLLSPVAPPSYEGFLEEVGEIQDWFEHLLNLMNPRYGADFYHATQNGKANTPGFGKARAGDDRKIS